MSATTGSPPTSGPIGREILMQLEGIQLEGGWVVGVMLPKDKDQTGGHFSVGYVCKDVHDRHAFLKAVDLFQALREPDVFAALHQLADGALCEQELLNTCRKMDRVVSALAFGTIREFHGQVLQIPVPYIILERADGNVRHVMRASARPSQEWILRTLHHVTVGLMQLHRERIAHQDLKLSNVLHFENSRVMKISDLGRSIRQGRQVWYDSAPWPGDMSYAPPEIAYGFTQSEFNAQRLAPDLYLLASFACALITGAPLNTLLYTALPNDFRPQLYRGSYSGNFANVAPHLQEAIDNVIDQIGRQIPEPYPHRADLLAFIRQWSTPDPRDRGHPLTRAQNANGGNIYDLERYASALPNLMAKAAAYERRRRPIS